MTILLSDPRIVTIIALTVIIILNRERLKAIIIKFGKRLKIIFQFGDNWDNKKDISDECPAQEKGLPATQTTRMRPEGNDS
jgi:hypothetical protein